MSSIKEIQALAAKILNLESRFGSDGAPPNDEAAAEWLRLITQFRAAHGLSRAYKGSHHRNSLRLPTNAIVQCRVASGTVEARCSVLARRGLGLSLSNVDIDVGTKLEIIEVEHLGKRYHLAAPGEVRWQQTVGADIQVGVRFDAQGAAASGTFSAWYLAVYQEYLRRLARGEVEPLLGREASRVADTQGVDDGEEPPVRMLIVDDELENLKLLERAFRHHFEIFTASDGSAALDVALRVKPQVVITDQRMPTTTGVQFLSNLRAHLPDTVRILVTGYVDYDTLVDAVNLAMVHHYVEKPVQCDNLVEIVKTLCERTRHGGES